MKQYESYKDSGIEWLGKIPSHWNSMPIKYILGKSKNNLRVGPFGSALSGDDFQNDGYWVYNQRTVLDNNFMSADAFISKEKYEALHSFAVEAGDILITTRGTIGKIAIVPNNFAPGILHPCIIKFRVDENLIDKVFLKYVFNDCNIISDQVRLNSNSTTIDVIYSYTLKDILIPLPSLSEQQTIVSYLNYKVGQVDAVIAEKEKMLEDLKAYRTAIISEAVTKGLDKNVEMKDSGNSAIGIIPKGWKVMKTLYCLSMPITDGPHTTPELYDSGIPFISAEAVSCGNGKIDFSHMRGYISQEFYEECCKKYIPQKDDIYMIKSGATTGKIAIVDTDRLFTIWSPLAVFRCDRTIMLPHYLFFILQSPLYQTQVEIGWSFGTQQNIGMRVLEKIQIPVPTIEEQQVILDYLIKKDSKTEDAIIEIQSQIDDLKAYRSSVITEAVIGKVDLRDWKPNNDKK